MIVRRCKPYSKAQTSSQASAAASQSSSDGNATAAENVYVKSDYTIAVCSYAEAMIQKEEV